MRSESWMMAMMSENLFRENCFETIECLLSVLIIDIENKNSWLLERRVLFTNSCAISS